MLLLLLLLQGLRGLYGGYSACLITDCTSSAVHFVAYEQLKQHMRQRAGRDTLTTPEVLLAGGSASALATVVTNPLDMVATRIMTRPDADRSVFRGVREIARREGWRACWKGTVARVLNVAPMYAISFAVYEKLKVVLGEGRAADRAAADRAAAARSSAS